MGGWTGRQSSVYISRCLSLSLWFPVSGRVSVCQPLVEWVGQSEVNVWGVRGVIGMCVAVGMWVGVGGCGWVWVGGLVWVGVWVWV